MMATFYTFKDKKNLTEPLVKNPGDIDGQMFDIGDCENSTLVIMDNCEQVQIDQVNNCRIFIGACASSIFIRNCENCVFYTSCRQLRLREVVNSTFYIYSMSEVHIEYSNALKFAPFNGGYPEHAKHLSAANLDPAHNLWYDIFDHNDPGKDKGNWSLLPVSEYEAPWFPAGAPCIPAVPITAAGSVIRTDLASDNGGSGVEVGGEQAFSIQQMIADAEKIKAAASAPPAPPASLPPAPVAAEVAAPPVPLAAANTSCATLSGSNLEVVAAICAYANFKSAEELLKVRISLSRSTRIPLKVFIFYLNFKQFFLQHFLNLRPCFISNFLRSRLLPRVSLPYRPTAVHYRSLSSQPFVSLRSYGKWRQSPCAVLVTLRGVCSGWLRTAPCHRSLKQRGSWRSKGMSGRSCTLMLRNQ